MGPVRTEPKGYLRIALKNAAYIFFILGFSEQVP